MPRSTEINNKNGTVSPYGFMCGYMEVYGDWLGSNGVRLYADGCYHVRGIVKDADNPALHNLVWEVFHDLKEARKFARTFGKYQQPT